jgi:hypothetical protein
MKCSGGDPFIPEKKTFDQHDGNEGLMVGIEPRKQHERGSEDDRVVNHMATITAFGCSSAVDGVNMEGGHQQLLRSIETLKSREHRW